MGTISWTFLKLGMKQRCSYQLLGSIVQSFIWLVMTQRCSYRLMGTTPQNFSKTWHDANMFVPTLGEYHFKIYMTWFGTQSDHTNSWGLQVDLSYESITDSQLFWIDSGGYRYIHYHKWSALIYSEKFFQVRNKNRLINSWTQQKFIGFIHQTNWIVHQWKQPYKQKTNSTNYY